jgi:hypothetical protein
VQSAFLTDIFAQDDDCQTNMVRATAEKYKAEFEAGGMTDAEFASLINALRNIGVQQENNHRTINKSLSLLQKSSDG